MFFTDDARADHRAERGRYHLFQCDPSVRFPQCFSWPEPFARASAITLRSNRREDAFSATTLALIAGPSGITVTVICTPPATNVFYIQSTAQFGIFGAPDFVQRRLEATVTNLP